jgi:hypothetical protein
MSATPLSDWTILIQGPVIDAPWLYAAVDKLRASAPGCPIYLSTWIGTVVDESKFDRIVFSKDPGASSLPIVQVGPFRFKATTVARPIYPNNLRRFIVSAKAGLDVVRTRYTLKCRTDFIPADARMIHAYSCLPARSAFSSDEACFINESLILTLEWFSRDPLRLPYLHHPGDIVMAGLTRDLAEFFDCPLPDEVRHCNEQYLWINRIKKKQPLSFPHGCSFTPMAALESERLMLNNFRFHPMGDFSGFSINKDLRRHNTPPTCYRPEEHNARLARLQQKPYIAFFLLATFLRYVLFTGRGLLGCIKRPLKRSFGFPPTE